MISPQVIRTVLCAACGLLLSAAFLLEIVFHQLPCPLCVIQRLFLIGMILVTLLPPYRKPHCWQAVVFTLLSMLALSVALRQVYLQLMPQAQLSGCGGDLRFMLQNLPFLQVIFEVYHGSGSCSEMGMTFLGLSLAMWAAFAFAGLSGIGGYWVKCVVQRTRVIPS